MTLSNQEQDILKTQDAKSISPPTPPLSSSSVSSLSSSPHSPNVKTPKIDKFKEEAYDSLKVEGLDPAYNEYDKKYLGFSNGSYLNNANFFAKKFFAPAVPNNQYNFHLSQLQHEQNYFNNQYHQFQNQLNRMTDQSFNAHQTLKCANSSPNLNCAKPYEQKPQINSYNSVNTSSKSESNQSSNLNDIIPLMSKDIKKKLVFLSINIKF